MSDIPKVKVRERQFKYNLIEKRSILLEQKHTGCSNVSIAKKYQVRESAIRKWRKVIDTDIEPSAIDLESKQKTVHPNVGFIKIYQFNKYPTAIP